MSETTAAPEPVSPLDARRARYPTGPWTAAAAAVCGCVLVAAVDPTEHMLTPPCPLRVMTGWWCPFCGATRAASRLVRGDVPAAFHFNALLVVTLPLVLALWAAWAFPGRLAWLDPLRRRATPVVVALAVIAGLFLVTRNTIAADWLRYPGA